MQHHLGANPPPGQPSVLCDSLRTFPQLAIAVGAALLLSGCSKATAPVAPASTGPRVVATASTLVPLSAHGGTPQYRISGEVAFRESGGVGGRITEMTLAVAGGQGQASVRTIPLDLAVPPGGVVTQPISEQVDVGTQAPLHLRIAAAGVDVAGRAFAVPAVSLPIAMTGGAGSPFSHVFILVEENEQSDNVIGSPSMPYLNGLASQYAQATQYYANTHPSIGNYFMLTVGEIVTNNSGFSGTVSADNIVRQLVAAGRTWKSYAEDLPWPGYTGGDTGGYVRRHNPLAAISDVADNPAQAANLVPFTQFAADLAANALPDYSFIVPNLCHDGHDCPMANADAWLQSNIAPLIASTVFQKGGLLIITFDEAGSADVRLGGGRVAWIAVSSKSKRGYRSSALYQHESTLRLTAEALGLASVPNRGASAPGMNEFFAP